MGYGSYRKEVIGKNNRVFIGKGTSLEHTVFRIVGENNTIFIGDNCRFGKGCSIWLEGNDVKITIGSNTSFTQYVHLNAQEEKSCITIGGGCMFSNSIIVRTSDSHPIFDVETGKRLNSAKSVVIGNNVWVAPDTKIMKGAIIGDGSIIGSNTMVGSVIPPNSLAVGMPAKVIRSNVRWTFQDVIFHKYE